MKLEERSVFSSDMMNDDLVRKLLKKAIDKLILKDTHLLINDLSEQSISHKIGEYLQELFPDYNVDCEYNGDVDRENNKKCISVLKSDLIRKGLVRKIADSDLEKEYTERAVFPDIIIHKRGSNESNLCIIEVKKSTSGISREYDHLKLEAYTSSKYRNNLKYQLGFFLKIYTGQKPDYSLLYFKDGQKVEHLNGK